MLNPIHAALEDAGLLPRTGEEQDFRRIPTVEAGGMNIIHYTSSCCARVYPAALF